MICDVSHLHPCCTDSLDNLRGCIGFFVELLGDRPWDIDLTPFVTQQLQPAQIAENTRGDVITTICSWSKIGGGAEFGFDLFIMQIDGT